MMNAILAALLSILSLFQGIPSPGPGIVGSHSSSGHTFTEAGANFSCSSSPCTISYTATSGNLLVVLFGNLGNADYITALSGGGTWTIPSACQVTNTNSSLSCAYIISNTGASSFSMSYGTGTGTGTIYQFSATGSGSVVIDGTPATASLTASATQTMISPSITGSSDAIVQAIQTESGVSVNSFGGA